VPLGQFDCWPERGGRTSVLPQDRERIRTASTLSRAYGFSARPSTVTERPLIAAEARRTAHQITGGSVPQN